MHHWKIIAFGKVTGTGFLVGRAFAPNASRAVELSGEPSAVAFPSCEHGYVANAQESFAWSINAQEELTAFPRLQNLSENPTTSSACFSLY